MYGYQIRITVYMVLVQTLVRWCQNSTDTKNKCNLYCCMYDIQSRI